MLGSDHGDPKFSPRDVASRPDRGPAAGPGRKKFGGGHFCFFLLQALEIRQNRQRNLWKSSERNSSDLERLGKKLGAGVMNYRKLYFSLNSPTCADVSGRIGSDRSIRNSLAVSSSSSVAPIQSIYESARHVTCSASAGDDALEDGKYFVLTLIVVMDAMNTGSDGGPSVISPARSATLRAQSIHMIERFISLMNIHLTSHRRDNETKLKVGNPLWPALHWIPTAAQVASRARSGRQWASQHDT